ncbi:MAG: PEGA domain-containing protein, partial [Labilithrix sp.]|nr:PEGA domain-containing protein [Labilithrix sp.]
WTRVTVNGKAVGSTPLVRLSLGPGTHTIVMENPGEGIRESTTVTIKSGETTSKRLAFDDK